MPHLILAMYLIRAQCHAARFFAAPCMIHHATKFFATPHLILGMLLHVLKMSAIELQKLTWNTSDVAHAKVITTGETTTPSLLITALPSINDLFAGVSCAHNLLQAQLATSQHILCEPVDLDDLPFRAQLVALQCTLCKPVEFHKLDIGNDNVYKLGIRHTMPCPRVAMCYKLCILCVTPCLTVLTRSLLAHHYDPFFEAYRGDYTELPPEKVVDNNGKPSCILPITDDITKHNPSGELITMDIKTFACVSYVQSFGRHMPVGPTGV